ncbi:RHS repeat-associated core domain-containing protein [Mesobacillus jeotgali]|uniref:RHS repeat-associated core domain-containing protein n=1 Tax=Mesobacillus jeotgali TaxID=129985 RepID=UPI0009A8A57D|nr:RHS repeat-associated core domain-containing protein [Mesobacillus jeotgali]
MGRRIYREEMSWRDFDGLKKGQEKGKGNENSKGKAKGKANCNDNAKSGNGPFNNPGQGKKLGLYKKYGENGKDHVYHKETTYLYEGLSNVLHKEYSATGSPFAEYYNGPDNQIVSRKMFGMHGLSNPAHDPALKTTGGMLYYQYDGARAVSEVTDRHGDIIERYRYDAFGSIFTGTTTPYNYHGYTGMRYDGKSGLVDMNARWYNPGTARFMSEDTYPGDVSQTQTLNRYAYVMNNPVNQWDPTGHMAEDLFGAAVPSWVKAGETNLIQVGTNTQEYWEPVPGTSPTPVPSEIMLVNTSTAKDGITDTYQQSFTTTWYYQYTTILIQDDIFKRLHDPREQTFSETETYQWDVFISAEEIAKGKPGEDQGHGRVPGGCKACLGGCIVAAGI